MFPEGEEGTQLPFPPCLGSLALGAAVLSEVPSLQHDAQQFGRGVCIRIRIRKFGAMQPEVFRQECMELRAPPEQAGPPVNGFQIPGGVASVQGVVGPRHVAELPKADTVPQQVFQEVGVQQQQVRQGGTARRLSPGTPRAGCPPAARPFRPDGTP
ncbi:MAG: hypothetical protein LUD26_09630 [Bacteroides uniformis]|nr:hypothetical protein [Bacteroides uniformis]